MGTNWSRAGRIGDRIRRRKPVVSFCGSTIKPTKKMAFKNKNPTAWHTLPPEQEWEGNEDG